MTVFDRTCWISVKNVPKQPFVAAYRLVFELKEAISIPVQVSADERYILYLNGAIVGRGSELGTPESWFYENYNLRLKKGKNIIAAKVWSLKDISPFNQLSVRHGFIFNAPALYTDLLSSGLANWQGQILKGYKFIYPDYTTVTGAATSIDGKKYCFDFYNSDKKWQTPVKVNPVLVDGLDGSAPGAPVLKAARLPAMRYEEISQVKTVHVSKEKNFKLRDTKINSSKCLRIELEKWNSLLNDRKKLSIPANSIYRIIIDLQNYYCVYPQISLSSGKDSLIKFSWAESLYEIPFSEETNRIPKGNRNIVDGKYCWGPGDIFRTDGTSSKFDTLNWYAGRYFEIILKTRENCLTINSILLYETGYPLIPEFIFRSDKPELNKIIKPCLKTLQMCMHETFMDCPYYEKLMYVGDTRIQALINYTITQDDRLIKKSIEMFNYSRDYSGLTWSRYPSKYKQIIPPFSLLWIAMIYDFALWRGDAGFIVQNLPGIRSILDAFEQKKNSGLVENLQGWNFIDWVPQWERGEVPDSGHNCNSVINLLYIMALQMTSELEQKYGDKDFSLKFYKNAEKLKANVYDVFWDKAKGLLADDIDKKYFSEHAQILTIINNMFTKDARRKIMKKMYSSSNIAKTSIYFSHYLFEACSNCGFENLLVDRLDLWYKLGKNGLKTVYEEFEPSRSDCHAWGSHPIYHLLTTIAGIRPGSLGFDSVIIRPALCDIKNLYVEMPHPCGNISVNYTIEHNTLKADISLPDKINGIFKFKGQSLKLLGGENHLII